MDTSHTKWSEIGGFLVDRGKWVNGQPGTFTVRKKLDRASGPAFLAMVKGTIFPLVKIDLAKAFHPDLGEPVFWRVELKNAVVTRYETGGASDETPEERLSLAFQAVTYTYVYGEMLNQEEKAGFNYVTGTVTDSPGNGGGNGDTDSDGMPDTWETTYGFNVNVPDGHGDADGDGFTNLEEYQLGTHPRQGTSFFRAVVTPNPAQPGQLLVSWNSVAGKTYVVEWTENPAQPFTPVTTFTATGASSQVSVPQEGSVGFYRVRPQ